MTFASNFDIILVFLQIGLQAWTTALDEEQQTPHAYALMRNNHTYNALVGEKLANQRRAQGRITISKEPSFTAIQGADGTVGLNIELSQVTLQKFPSSCSIYAINSRQENFI